MKQKLQNCYQMKNTIINYKKLKNLYNTLVTNENNGLTKKDVDYLVNFERNESNFNGLPKMVKSKEVCVKQVKAIT